MNYHTNSNSGTAQPFVTVLPPIFTRTGTNHNASRMKLASIARLETVDNHRSIVHVDIPDGSNPSVIVEKLPNSTANVLSVVMQGGTNSEKVSREKDAGLEKYSEEHPFYPDVGCNISCVQPCKLHEDVEVTDTVLGDNVLHVELKYQPPVEEEYVVSRDDVSRAGLESQPSVKEEYVVSHDDVSRAGLESQPSVKEKYAVLCNDILRASLNICCACLDILRARLNILRAKLDICRTGLDICCTGLDICCTGLDIFRTKLDTFRAELESQPPVKEKKRIIDIRQG